MQTDTIHYSLFTIHFLIGSSPYEKTPRRVGEAALCADELPA